VGPWREQAGIGGLMAVIEENGPTLVPLSDGLGNVTAVLNTTNGQVVARYDYGPFGEPLGESGDTDACPFRWQTKWYDAESQHYYFGYRHYDPRLGRWLSRDPMGEDGGFNLYAYCGNDPVNRHDPLGLADRNDALLQSDQFGNWLTYDQKQANILKTIGDLCGATWYEVKGILPQAFAETKEGLPQAAFQMDAGMTKMAYENPVLAVPARPINWLAQGTLHLNPMILAGDVSLIADNGVGNTAKQWGRKIGNDVDRVFTERSLDSFLDIGEDVADVATLIEGGRGLLKTAGRALPTPWFALDEMEGVGMRLNPRAGIAGAINPQGDLLRRSAVQPGVITSDVVRFHHPWPKYLGGSLQQILEPLPKSLHDAFHSGLDKILARQVGTAYYENLSSAARTQCCRTSPIIPRLLTKRTVRFFTKR
jgi:RHS repeat-associated protein